MSHPIGKKMGAVFIHVEDLQASINWYSKLLNQPVRPGEHEGPVYWFEMADGVMLLLDDNRNNPKGMVRPGFMYATHDIDAAYAFIKEIGGEIVREIERDPMVSFFNFKDPDGNVNMVCQSHQ
jgi:uncharacterized protein